MDWLQLGDLRSQHLFVGRPSPRSGLATTHRVLRLDCLRADSQKFKESKSGQGRKAVDTVHRRIAMVSERDPGCQINLPRRRAAVK